MALFSRWKRMDVSENGVKLLNHNKLSLKIASQNRLFV